MTSINISSNDSFYSLSFTVWEKSQDVEAGTTTLSWYLMAIQTQGGSVSGSGINATINGQSVISSLSGSWSNGKYVKSGTYTFNNRIIGGTEYVSIALEGYVGNAGELNYGKESSSFTVAMDRHAYFVSMDDFYHVGNPTFTYKTRIGSDQIETIWIDADFFEDVKEVPIIEPSETGTFTIELTDTERISMINQYLDESSGITTRQLEFTLKTKFIGAGSNYDYRKATLRLAQNPPTFNNPTVRDLSATAIALTGDNTKLVRFISNAEIYINAEAMLGSELTEFGVTNGSFSYVNDNPALVTAVESNVFTLFATDNRGLRATQEITVPFVEYVKLTCNLKNGAITGVGSFDVNVTGNYFNGSFGKENNELFVYYRYKVAGDDNEFSDWIPISNISYGSGSTYTAKATVQGLDYQTSYVFQASAADIYATVNSTERDIVSLPIFDWSATDFNFNVPVSLRGKQIDANRILWEGNDVMLANANLELNELISEQMSGIALVFSNASGDVSWNIHFVPKEMINFYNGGGHTFLMAVNAGLSTFGAKYLYISDGMITGHETNESSGTGASGIKFSNANYVLRYVIGV